MLLRACVVGCWLVRLRFRLIFLYHRQSDATIVYHRLPAAFLVQICLVR